MCLFGALALGNVGCRAGPPNDLARIVAPADRLEAVPAGLPADDVTHFHGKPLTGTGEQRLPRRLPSREILRVHVDPRFEVVPVLPRVGIVSPHLICSARGDILIGGDEPIPVSRLAGSHGEFVAFLGFAQRLFGALAFCYISHRAGPANYRAGRVARCHADKLHPTRLTVPFDAGLDVAANRLAGKVFGKNPSHQRTILGVEWQPRDKVITAGETRARREAIDLQQPWRRVDSVVGDDPVPETIVAGVHGTHVAFLVLQLPGSSRAQGMPQRGNLPHSVFRVKQSQTTTTLCGQTSWEAPCLIRAGAVSAGTRQTRESIRRLQQGLHPGCK